MHECKSGWDREKDLAYFISLWEQRKSSGMSHRKEDWDERSHKWVDGLENDPDKSRRGAERVSATADYLRSKGLLSSEDDVIDIGCGPGRFVAEFAKTARRAVGTDISTGMCGYGEEFAVSKGLHNVSFVSCDFKKADIDQMEWRKSFDLVFSSITPAMSTLESLDKSMEMSRKYCFQSNFVKFEDELLDDVLNDAFPGIPKMERSIRSTYVLMNILMLKGYFPEVTYYKEVSTVRRAADEKMAAQMLTQIPAAASEKDALQRVLNSLKKRADQEGMVERHSEVTYSWILWDVRR